MKLVSVLSYWSHEEKQTKVNKQAKNSFIRYSQEKIIYFKHPSCRILQKECLSEVSFLRVLFPELNKVMEP